MILKPKLITKIEPGHWASKGLVGSWIFNEGGGDRAYDGSGNGNHGTFVADARSVAGKFGNALGLDGTGDYMTTPLSDATLDQSTISLWARLNVRTTYYVFYSSDPGKSEFYVTSSGTVFISGNSFKTNAEVTPSTGVIVADRWYHFAVVQTLSGISLYVDAVLAHSDSFVTTPGGNINIGARPNGTLSVNGQIDNFSVYNRALSPTEIASLYTDPFQMFKRNL